MPRKGNVGERGRSKGTGRGQGWGKKVFLRGRKQQLRSNGRGWKLYGIGEEKKREADPTGRPRTEKGRFEQTCRVKLGGKVENLSRNQTLALQ